MIGRPHAWGTVEEPIDLRASWVRYSLATTVRGNMTKQDPISWATGYRAGLEGKTPPTPPDGVDDALAFQSGVIEGKADRLKQPEDRKHQTGRER